MQQFRVGEVVFPAGYDKHDKWAFLSSSTAEAKAKWLDDGAAEWRPRDVTRLA